MKQLTTLILASSLLVFSCGSKEEKKDTSISSTADIPVKVQSLVAQDIQPVIQTSGVFTTDDETNLSFKTGGVLLHLYVKEGDAVKKGQLLAILDLTEIEAQVSQAKLGLDKANRDLKRVENLYRDSVATLEQYQNARTGMDVAQKQFESATFNRSYSEIRSPGNGFVLRKLANEGQVISPGTTVLIANGASQSAWKLKVGVSDREWAGLSVGDKANVSTDALPGKTFTGVVTRKAEGTDAVSGTFMVEITIDDRKAALASGLFGKASIFASRKQRAWRIPYDALLDGNAQTGYVFTTINGKTALKTPVVVLGIEKQHVIIGGGLEQAKLLIVSGSAFLRDGSPIAVVQ
jgi:RND family efflux transporter MFP subunit